MVKVKSWTLRAYHDWLSVRVNFEHAEGNADVYNNALGLEKKSMNLLEYFNDFSVAITLIFSSVYKRST
jgi:hypothetical protein